jgi:hypothetical protein
VEANLKKSILALCALTMAASLVACGGGTSSYTIGGTVSGLQYPGLVLSNNLSDDLPLTPLPLDANGAVQDVKYQFAKQLDYGDPYSVTVKTQPAHQKCEAGGGTADTAGRLTVIEAGISCLLVSNTVGGTITGLAADGLELNNGSVSTGKIVKDTTTLLYPTSFTLPELVTYKQTYGVTVLTQPTGQTCTVKNGAGEMGDNAVTTVEVSCVNNPA